MTDLDFTYTFINSLTALSAELEGRHYGGGVLELVPTEIEKLLIPKYTQVTKNALEDLDLKIRESNYENIFALQNNTILKSIGLNSNEISILYSAWLKLKNRRQRKN